MDAGRASAVTAMGLGRFRCVCVCLDNLKTDTKV